MTQKLFISFLMFLAVPAQAQTIDWSARTYARTTLQGIYSDTQAARGLITYRANCSRCHQDSLFGGEQPLPLVQDRFLNRWREESLHPLLVAMKTMPKDREEKLSESEYADILAYLMKANSFPAGDKDLKASDLADIQLITQAGTQPLPVSAGVQVVGCFTRTPNGAWQLTNATSFLRSRNLSESKPEELKAAIDAQLGSRTIPVENIEYLSRPDFKVESLSGHKVHLKGALNRRNGVESIKVTWFESVSPSCSK